MVGVNGGLDQEPSNRFLLKLLAVWWESCGNYLVSRMAAVQKLLEISLPSLEMPAFAQRSHHCQQKSAAAYQRTLPTRLADASCSRWKGYGLQTKWGHGDRGNMVSKLKCQALGYFTTLVTSSIDSETQDALRAIRIQERLATHGMTAVVHVMSCFDALKNRELLVRFGTRNSSASRMVCPNVSLWSVVASMNLRPTAMVTQSLPLKLVTNHPCAK